MLDFVDSLLHSLLGLFERLVEGTFALLRSLAAFVRRSWLPLTGVGLIVGAGYELYSHPPFKSLEPTEVGIRTNTLTGETTELREGLNVVLPGLHELRRYSLLDQVYHPTQNIKANGAAPFQSVEGLSIGVDITVRYALDPSRINTIVKKLPSDLDREIIQPTVQGVVYQSFTHYSVRDIYSAKRGDIQKEIEDALKAKLGADGVILKSVTMGEVDLPAEYRAGMEKLLAEELETEKMKYTLELKDKQVKQTELEAEADKVKRQKAAEAAGDEQIIAARAQEEAMKHVLPFKQKQIEQRQFEAEAEKVARVKSAEGNAEARRIEAAGEADSRRKLADADAYRLDSMGKIASAQLERDGALISKNPLLIQKTMADKLSDKISVIIAPPSVSGSFIGSGLLGTAQATPARTADATQDNATESQQ